MNGAKTTQNRAKGANQRGVARLAAVQALYQMDIGDAALEDVMGQFRPRLKGGEFNDENYLPGDADFFGQILKGVLKNQLAIDPKIDEALVEDWPVERIDSTLRAVLRAGAFELLYRTDIPKNVVLSEYVDVANAFFEGAETGMVNAVLDKIEPDAA